MDNPCVSHSAQEALEEKSAEPGHCYRYDNPMYGHYFEDDARASDGLFEENLKPWANAMMEGQFGARTMAQLEALNLLTGLDLEPFKGLQRIARNCCWWCAFDLGAVLCERRVKVSASG